MTDSEKQKRETPALYVWLDEDEKQVRSKAVMLDKDSDSVSKLPLLNLNGDAKVFLKPVAIFNDPFSSTKNKLVLSEVMKYDKKSKSK